LITKKYLTFGIGVIHPAPNAAEVRNFTRILLREYVSLIGERRGAHENIVRNAKGGRKYLGRDRYRWKVNMKSRKIVL
jgi:hypothetical protein